LNKLTSVAAGE